MIHPFHLLMNPEGCRPAKPYCLLLLLGGSATAAAAAAAEAQYQQQATEALLTHHCQCICIQPVHTQDREGLRGSHLQLVLLQVQQRTTPQTPVYPLLH
jgi:hypothetical protein